MKNIDLADIILIIKISKRWDGLILSQSRYVDKILENINKDNSNVARTPIDTS